MSEKGYKTMTQNYFKGKITVIFPPTSTTPLFGKILPIWGKETNKGDQINFNVFALRSNIKFPEEGGACEVNYQDTRQWTKKENGGKTYYVPNIPFEVYFKLKRVVKDGSTKFFAVAIMSPENLDAKEKFIADKITVQPSAQELLAPKKVSMIEALEMACTRQPSPIDNKNLTKGKKKSIIVTDEDEKSELDELEESINNDYSTPATCYSKEQCVPIDNSDGDEYIEEGKEENTIDEDEYSEKDFNIWKEVAKHHKQKFDDAK